MAELCNLPGIFCDPAGAPFGGAKLVIRPVSTQPTVRGDGAIVAAVAVSTFETAEDGAVMISLAPGLYRGSATQGAGGRSFNFDLAVPDLETAPLEDYIGRVDVDVQTSAQRARDEAVQAAEDTAALFTAAGGVAQAVANAGAAAEATADDLAIVQGLRDEVELIAGTGVVAFYNSIALGRAAVADGASFGVRAGLSDGLTRPTIYRRDSSSTQTLIVELVSAGDMAIADAQVQTLASGLRGSGFEVQEGRMVLARDAAGPLDSIDLLTGRRRIENLTPTGGEMLVQDGRMPIIRDARGTPIIEIDLFDHLTLLPAPAMAKILTPPQHGLRPTEWGGLGVPLAGYAAGEYIRLHPARHAGLIIRGDHNRIPQLWWAEDSGHGVCRTLRQITFSQHGVTGYRWVKLPTMDDPGEVILEHGDGDLIRDRRFVTRRAKIPLKARAATPTKVVSIMSGGQSKSVGAGTTTSPSRVTGPQTIRTHLPVQPVNGEASAWSHELMTFVGGTMPHQVAVDATAINIAIDPAQLASLVPMVEGLGGTASNQGGSREGHCSALALHLAGPNGYDGGAYVIAASFGHGSSSFQDLFYDGTTRKQSYLNLLAGIQKAQDFAAAKGLPHEAHVHIDQGENNASEGRATNYARLIEFLPIMQADIVAITGQATPPQLFLSQTTWTRGTNNEPCHSALAQMDAALAEADIHILPPDYWADYENDVVHMKAPENQLKGALFGECIADWLIRGQDAALHMTAATWNGNTINLQMSHPVETDADTILNLDKSLGFSHVNSGGAAASVSVVQPAASDPTVLTVTCSTAITSGTTETVRIAHSNATGTSPEGMSGHAKGLRSGFRRADWQRYSLIDGRPLMIFANLQSIDATEV